MVRIVSVVPVLLAAAALAVPAAAGERDADARENASSGAGDRRSGAPAKPADVSGKSKEPGADRAGKAAGGAGEPDRRPAAGTAGPVSEAAAGKKAPEAAGARGAPAVPRLYQRIRALEVVLAEETRSAPGGIRVSASENIAPAVVESAAPRRRSTSAPPPQPAADPERSPLDRALERVTEAVLARHPKASGRVAVSFTVGRGGVPREVMVISFDAKLDPELEKRLGGATFPEGQAGLHVSTNLVFRGGEVSVR